MDEGVNGNIPADCVILALSKLIGDEALDVLLMLLIKVSNSSNEIDENAWFAIGQSAYHPDPGLRDPRKGPPACHHHSKEHEPRNGIRGKTIKMSGNGKKRG